jgi:hypothetical protein
MLVLSQYHIFESYKINIYSVHCLMMPEYFSFILLYISLPLHCISLSSSSYLCLPSLHLLRHQYLSCHLHLYIAPCHN